MSKEKNKNTFRIGALLLVACLISSVMLSGTFAKYTSEYAGQDTALVARWSFGVEAGQTGNLEEVNNNATQELDLLTHAYNAQMTQSVGVDYLIAPGVSGNFVLDLANDSDVEADITFDLGEVNTGLKKIPMEFSLAEDFTTKYNSVEALENALNLAHIHLAESDTTTETVYWRWAYDNTTNSGNWTELYGEVITSSDVADTALGTESAGASRTKYILSIKVIATQSVPANFTMGAITVNNTLTEGQTLNAGALSGGTVTYQWQRSDSINGTYTNITVGGTVNPYTLHVDDVGKYIRVIATGTDTNVGAAISGPVGPIVGL